MIGGKSYDDYLREQERKNRTYGYETRDAFKSQTEVAEKTQTYSPKKSVPVEGIFLTVFGGVFFLFGLFFIFILHSVLPSDESVMLLVYLGPGIFVVVGLIILSVGIYSLATRRPVGKLYIRSSTVINEITVALLCRCTSGRPAIPSLTGTGMAGPSLGSSA